MSEFVDDEQTIKNRITLREATVRKLTSKYLELISKFNTLTRSEMAQAMKEILNELEMIEISILKAENLGRLREIDTVYQRSLGSETDKKVEIVVGDIVTCSRKLIEAKNEKEYKIHCEEVAKIINSYDSKDNLLRDIHNLENEISKIKSNDKLISDKLGMQTKRLSLLVKLVNDLKSKFDEDYKENELEKDDKMLID